MSAARAAQLFEVITCWSTVQAVLVGGVGSSSHEQRGAVPSHVDISLPCQSAVLPVVAHQHRAQVAAVLAFSVFLQWSARLLCLWCGAETVNDARIVLALDFLWLDGA